MRARTLYLVAGLAWGIALGILAIAVAAGLAVAVFWAMLYGDGPWPAWSGPVIATVAVLAGMGTFIGAIAVGLRLGRRADAAGDPPTERRRAGALLGLGVAALAAVVLLGRPGDMPEIQKPDPDAIIENR